jgi:hypothetical protein
MSTVCSCQRRYVRQLKRQLQDAQRRLASSRERARRGLGAWSKMDGSFDFKSYYKAFAEKIATGG